MKKGWWGWGYGKFIAIESPQIRLNFKRQMSGLVGWILEHTDICYLCKLRDKYQVWFSWMGSWWLQLPGGCPFFLLLYGGRLKSFGQNFPSENISQISVFFQDRTNLSSLGTVWMLVRGAPTRSWTWQTIWMSTCFLVGHIQYKK